MKHVLLLILLGSALQGHATPASQLAVTRNVWHDFVQQLPRWRELLGTTMLLGQLLSSSPALAQEADIAAPAEWQQVARDEHFSVLTLVLSTEKTLRESHVVYVGRDVRGRELFIAKRFNLLSLPVRDAESLIADSEAWLFDAHGLVQQGVAVAELRAFLRPDTDLVRLYDLAVLAVEVDAGDYHAVTLNMFPPASTALHTVAYHFNMGAEDWVERFSNASLLQRKCSAGQASTHLWSANSDCTFGKADRGITAPVFSAAGELVGFNINEGEVSTIPAPVLEYFHYALDIETPPTLSVTWGAIKKAAR